MAVTPVREQLPFSKYDFLVEGALDCRMVSTTSAGRPNAMSCATVSTTLGRGEKLCPLPVRGDPAGRESPMESLLEGLPLIYYQIYCKHTGKPFINAE